MDEKETGRIEAFSDGVFAVAITLLVLNIKIPGLDLSAAQLPDDTNLWITLGREWPMLAAYGTSFATIGVMWLNHHKLFVHIKHTNTVLMLIILLLLLIIVFIPVPTALLAEYLVRPNLHAAAVSYSSTFLMMATCFNLLWRYVSYHNRLLGKSVDSRSVKAISRQYVFALFFTLLFSVWLGSTHQPVLSSVSFSRFFALPGRPLQPVTQEEN